MIRKTLVLLMVFGFLGACNTSFKDSVASGKAHRCEINKLTEQLKEKPDDKDLNAQLKERLEFYKIVKESSGDPEKFDKEVAEKVKKGCD